MSTAIPPRSYGPHLYLDVFQTSPRTSRRFLNNNRISTLESGCFTNLSSSLQVLRLNRNRLSTIPAKIFQLPNLLHL